MNNKKLAIRLRNDDVEAFNTLYWKYHVDVYANVLKLIHDTAIAEDIVQEVFIALWEKRRSIDPDQNVSGWLFVVSFNKSVSLLKQKLKESLAQKSLEQVIEEETDENIDLVDNPQLTILKRAIEELSPKKRKVFELCKMQGKTYEEAAKELQISKYTIKEYLSGSVTFIREYIQKHSEHQTSFIFAAALANYLYSW